jgi:hypothetical protein
MLYDVFISHASEDKDEIVRPLAELLRQHRVEVWYDEFTLVAGMSLRCSIDLGLSKSRCGIVILSPHFFGKSWPEWELNGLIQRHLSASRILLLPVWHQVTKEMVAAYSPSLADIFAVHSSIGLDEMVRGLLKVIQPEESALICARNVLLDRGYEPPVVSDDWWLNVIENSGWQNQQRWCLPVWRMTSKSSSRGESLAWIVMQQLWQDKAENLPITQMTRPSLVVDFMRSQPGLSELFDRMPSNVLEFAPQLAIRGVGQEFESAIERVYRRSVREADARRARNDRFGSGITTNHLSPPCDECFALRHPTFGDYNPGEIACGFVQGYGGGFGPHTRAFPVMEYVVWLLSKDSAWLPPGHRAFLLRGMKEWGVWPWSEYERDSYSGAGAGVFYSLMTSFEGRKGFRMTPQAIADLSSRVAHAKKTLHLPEHTADLTERFLAENFIESWFATRQRNRRAQRTSSRKVARKKSK